MKEDRAWGAHAALQRLRCTSKTGQRIPPAQSARLAASLGGHYMDQFTYAERATDWRGNNNIADRVAGQIRLFDDPHLLLRRPAAPPVGSRSPAASAWIR
jgi:cysteine synthase